MPKRDLDLPIRYSDESMVVVEKPTGMLSIPGRGPDKQDCVIARVRQRFPEAKGSLIVHRLDMDTSGLLIVSLNADAQRNLCAQFEQRTVHKRYEALVGGDLPSDGSDWSRIELRFRLDPNDRPRQIYDPENGKLGITEWRMLSLAGADPRVELRPLTGRTHQLRLHAAHELGLGAPIVGDRLYGTTNGSDRLCLHATELRFLHPRSGEAMLFKSPAPF